MMLVTAPPASPALAPFVQRFGYLEAPFELARERVLPTGGMQLLVNLDANELRTYHPEGVRRVGGAVLQGVGQRASIIDTAQQRAIAWVTFHPGGAYPFFPAPTSETADTLVDLDSLWSRDGATLRERLLEVTAPADRFRVLEAALLANAARSLTPDPAIRHAVRRLERGAAVGAVTDDLGITRQQLARRFGDRVGLTPKSFARVRRFQRLIKAVSRAGEPNWAMLAAEHGYCDQSHMIHEFQDFSGLSPSRYRPRSAAELNHVPEP